MMMLLSRSIAGVKLRTNDFYVSDDFRKMAASIIIIADIVGCLYKRVEIYAQNTCPN